MKAIVIGATGLIGNKLVRQLLAKDEYDQVVTLVRKSSGLSNKKLEEVVINFDEPSSYSKYLTGDVLFCALGTTIKKAGSQAAFRKIDFQYVVDFASVAAKNGIKRFSVVSSLGSKSDTSNFYLRTKGEMEKAIALLSFESVYIFRPSLLLGDRQETRTGEKIAEFFFKIIGFVFVGKLKRYKPVQGSAVAKAMINAGISGKPGFHIVESEMIGD
ncbi:MAG: NAD(P)H-binding protein [Ignavibacteriales bacterium]|nr:NAD(P)H-binding protein [Ignavibacteriales bacterium]